MVVGNESHQPLRAVYTLRRPGLGCGSCRADPEVQADAVMLFVHDRLDPDRVALGALLPYVQKRGTRSHPTGKALERAAGELYDAELSGGVHKVGDRQTIAYSLDIVSRPRTSTSPSSRRGSNCSARWSYEPAEPDGAFDRRLRRAGEALSDRPGQGAGEQQDRLRPFPLHRGDV